MRPCRRDVLAAFATAFAVETSMQHSALPAACSRSAPMHWSRRAAGDHTCAPAFANSASGEADAAAAAVIHATLPFKFI